MDNPLTIQNVTADMTITANFAIDTHTVTFVEGANGSMNPYGLSRAGDNTYEP